jgi:exopolysaccharide production protein ExoZ
VHTNKYNSIESLRLIAAILVLYTHFQVFCYSGAISSGFNSKIFNGAIGVDIFFVISGFVIHQFCQRAQKGWLATFEFLISRVLRIYPIYILSTSLVFFYHFISKNPDGIQHFVESALLLPSYKNQTYIDPIMVLGWTLRFEIFFYIIVGLSLVSKRWSTTSNIIAVLILVAAIARVRGKYYGASIIVEFVFGVLLSVFRSKHMQVSIKPKTSILLLFGALGSVLLVSTGIESSENVGSQGNQILRMKVIWDGVILPRWMAWGIPSAFLVLMCLLNEDRVQWWFSSYGKYTYSIYVMQYFSIWLLKKMAENGIGSCMVLFFILIFVTAILAYCSYQFIELPFIKLAQYIKTRVIAPNYCKDAN